MRVTQSTDQTIRLLPAHWVRLLDEAEQLRNDEDRDGMAAVLTHLRGRPWLVPCVVMLAIGLFVLASSRHGYLLTWAGILLIIGGLLGIVSWRTWTQTGTSQSSRRS